MGILASTRLPRTGDLELAAWPFGPASSNGLPSGRLVTGLFAMAISLAMGWRAGPTAVELARTEAPPPKQQEATVDRIDRQEPEPVKAKTLHESISQPAAPAQVERTAARRPPGSPKQRHQLQRTTTHAKVQFHLSAQRKAGADPWAIDYNPIAHARLTRRRSEVRSEYIAAREQVAALASEDSGSAYLTRQAARQSAARTNLAAHAHGSGQASRRAPARS
jgi:hypothetical protein